MNHYQLSHRTRQPFGAIMGAWIGLAAGVLGLTLGAAMQNAALGGGIAFGAGMGAFIGAAFHASQGHGLSASVRTTQWLALAVQGIGVVAIIASFWLR